MAHSTPQGILDDVAMVSWNWFWFLFKLMWSYFSLGICGLFILNITSRFIELFLMRTCLCLGSRWRGRSLHSKNVEAVDIWNWGKEDRTGEIKPTRLSEFVRSQFCYLPVSGLSTCVYKTPPFHQQGAAALCVCVCVCVWKGNSELWTERFCTNILHDKTLVVFFSFVDAFVDTVAVAFHPSVLQYVGHILLWFTVIMSRRCSIVWTNKYAFF